MPVQYGFPPEAETARDQPAIVPAKTLLDMLAEKRDSKKDDSNATQDTMVDSPPPGNKQDERPTPSKLEAPAPKKRPGTGRASAPPAVKKARDSRA